MLLLKFFNDQNWRKQQIRYWLLDPFWGGLDFCCYYLFRWMPLDIPSRIGAFLGQHAAFRFKKANERARNNLKFLKPELADEHIERLLVQMWRNIGSTMSEYSIADLLWKDGRVTVENDHFVTESRLQGRPLIIVTGHFANWEVISGYCIDHNIALLSLYQPERNRFVAKIADMSRRRIGTETVAAGGNALRIMCKHLQKGGALWFAIDEYKDRQVCMPSLGRYINLQTTNAAYAVRLAQRFNAVIIPYITERKPLSHFKVTVCEPLNVAENSDVTLKQLDQLVESWARAYTENWYMLHEMRL